jgi:dienelactone hydrolase
MARCFTWLFGSALSSIILTSSAAADPETVFFPSADGKTEIVGYLFVPATSGAHPAIVMLHGRSGPYSSNVNEACTLVSRSQPSPCNAAGLSKRHTMWGSYWARNGYLALLPDSFGPRGKAYGFGRNTHDDPARDDVNEKTVRPLDAEGALAYLRGREDVDLNRIFLQGWSNGGSTALNVMVSPGPAERGLSRCARILSRLRRGRVAQSNAFDPSAHHHVSCLRRRGGLAHHLHASRGPRARRRSADRCRDLSGRHP